jgi:2-hydroxymuconate-semialdehyde hydrolase
MNLELRRATVSAGEMAYADLGEGPPVVMLHGFPTSSHLWRSEAMLLGSLMRVLVPDLMGYGDSDRPEDPAALSITAQAGYVRELFQHLGIERFAVVAHDIGGGVAQCLALGGGVEVMVLVDSIGFDTWPIAGVQMLQDATLEQQTAEFVDQIVRLTLDVGISHEGRVSEGDIQAYVTPWMDQPSSFFRAARGIDGEGLAGREAELAALDLPVLIVWGEDDPFIPPEQAERLGELFPGSTVALLPGCSHFVNEDAPRTVGPLIFEFLRSRYLRQPHGHGHAVPSGPIPVYLERPDEGILFGMDLTEE